VRRWLAAGLVAGLVLGTLWVVWATLAPPLRVICDPGMSATVCTETADAGLRRGMPRLHPLITEAAVAPGPAFPDGYGHRATVRYSLVPGPVVSERLFFDAGGHWGAIPDRTDVELAAWALVPVVLTTSLGMGLGAALGRRSVRAATGP
jgi:hypothetical protein